jgi:hypothetical protein
MYLDAPRQGGLFARDVDALTPNPHQAIPIIDGELEEWSRGPGFA